MNAVFHWLPEKSAPLRAIRRALKPGGRFGLTTVTAERAGSWLHVIRQRVLARDPYNKYPEAQAMQNYRVSPGELEQMLLENGFAIAKLETRVSVRNASAHAAWTPESALDFAEASSFGNFLGHLPDELRAQAREDIKRELESLRARRSFRRGRARKYSTPRPHHRRRDQTLAANVRHRRGIPRPFPFDIRCANLAAMPNLRTLLLAAILVLEAVIADDPGHRERRQSS